MKVSELKAFLADKHDDQDIKIDMIPNFRVDVVPMPEMKASEPKPDEGAAPAVAEPVAA